jgi:superfamily II DNA or RNA helicase
MPSLHNLLDDMAFDALPPEWSTFALEAFSPARTLWEYQQAAVRNALKALWRYHDGDLDGLARKARFFQLYTDHDVPLDPTLPLGKKRDNTKLLAAYYPITQPATAPGKKTPEGVIDYQHFINRMGFWMATGSGKTLVIVKLLEALWVLMQRGLVPAHDVMVLTHREDLLKQLRDHINDFNTAGRAPHLRLRELREYPDVKREMPSLLGHQEMNVFCYRSDNLSDEQKERIIDFRNYDNNGQWYVLLDEAHKGDKEDSKRQHIYSILSRNGFLFNFSATFTDPRDIATTAFEFNLSSFITSGYGKHISLLRQENRAFKDKEDFNNDEKQRIVLQSLLMLTYVAKSRSELNSVIEAEMYHRPLLLSLVNSVNPADADLKLFFRELERIGKGEISPQAFTAAKQALRAELIASPEWLYETGAFTLDPSRFDNLKFEDVLKHVFNADTPGEIEVLERPSNDKELAFKLKTAADPFALIKIGNIAGWLKTELAGYEVVKGYQDDSFFAGLNRDDSKINLLMGSRSFYEGWDSNRPNVITFINIGTGTDAKKFILQSVGRGVRLEPLKGKRRRLASLHLAGDVADGTFQAAKSFLPAVETLFIFGTNRAALDEVFKGLEQEKSQKEGSDLALDVNKDALSSVHPVLIPLYRRLDGHLLMEQQHLRKFELQQNEQNALNAYVEYLGEDESRQDKLLLARHGLSPANIGLLHKTLQSPDDYFNKNTQRKYGRVDILLPRLTQYFGLIPQEVTGFKLLEEEINHFKHIRVTLSNIDALRQKITSVKNYVSPADKTKELVKKFQVGEISADEMAAQMTLYAGLKSEEDFTHAGQTLRIKHIAAHYYLPLLLSDNEKIDYINHIIRVKSEVHFVEQLEHYIKLSDNRFKQYDWWMFSRTDETTDKIILPYYDSTQNRYRDFHPDFVFWLVKGKQYTILFVDPKGMKLTDYQYKIDGYEGLFRNNGGYRTFIFGGYEVRVALTMYTTGGDQPPSGYADYWISEPDAMLKKLE